MDPYLLGQAWQLNALGMMEGVTLRIRAASTAAASDDFAGYNISRAIRFSIDQSMPTAAGAIATMDKLDWLIFQEALDSATLVSNGTTVACPVPNQDDQLVDSSGITWTVLSVSRGIDGQSHRLSCKANI
jgi:hypothetical protein